MRHVQHLKSTSYGANKKPCCDRKLVFDSCGSPSPEVFGRKGVRRNSRIIIKNHRRWIAFIKKFQLGKLKPLNKCTQSSMIFHRNLENETNIFSTEHFSRSASVAALTFASRLGCESSAQRKSSR